MNTSPIQPQFGTIEIRKVNERQGLSISLTGKHQALAPLQVGGEDVTDFSLTCNDRGTMLLHTYKPRQPIAMVTRPYNPAPDPRMDTLFSKVGQLARLIRQNIDNDDVVWVPKGLKDAVLKTLDYYEEKAGLPSGQPPTGGLR